MFLGLSDACVDHGYQLGNHLEFTSESNLRRWLFSESICDNENYNKSNR